MTCEGQGSSEIRGENRRLWRHWAACGCFGSPKRFCAQNNSQVGFEPFQKITASEQRGGKRSARPMGAAQESRSGVAKARLWQFVQDLIIAILEGQLCGLSYPLISGSDWLLWDLCEPSQKVRIKAYPLSTPVWAPQSNPFSEWLGSFPQTVRFLPWC